MANFAKIDDNNKVLAVVRMNNEDCLDENGNESEAVGQAHLEKHNNWPANLWIQTSYNTSSGQHKKGGTPLRGNYAGIGMTYDQDNDIFIGPKPFPSWVLNVAEARWQSPIGAKPALTAEQQSQNEAATHMWVYKWNESGQSWDLEDLKV